VIGVVHVWFNETCSGCDSRRSSVTKNLRGSGRPSRSFNICSHHVFGVVSILLWHVKRMRSVRRIAQRGLVIA
jgi:hypothetical protein